jgi:myosin heavy subunit
MLDDKQSILEKLGRDEVLQDVEDRIKSLIKTRREVLNDLQDQQIDRVERKVKTVQETTQAIADSEKEQGDLITDLKTTLDNQAITTQKTMREKAEQILEQAKDQVLHLHRDNFHFDGNMRVDDMDQAVPTMEQRMAILKAKREQLEYMNYLEEQQRKAEAEWAAAHAKPRTETHEDIYVVNRPVTRIVDEMVPELHTKVALVHERNHPGYKVEKSTHVDMVPVGVPVTQEQQELVSVPHTVVVPSSPPAPATTENSLPHTTSKLVSPASLSSGGDFVVPEIRL